MALNGCLQLHKELDSHAKISISSSNHDWLALADLILNLPGLLDFFFFFPTEFPECLLDRIHDFRSECRLHINLFLRNLATASTDSYEFRLASSPCLFSIKATHIHDHNPDNDKSSSYYEDLVTLMTSGLAPNLRAVTLVYHDYYSASLYSYVPPPWKGFGENTRTHFEKSRGNLKFLRLEHHFQITEKLLDHWSARTDFSKLQALELEAQLKPDTARYLATEFHFPCLNTVVLGRLRREAENSIDDHSEAVNKLLSYLPPLKSLTLDQWYPEISIEAMAIRHGPSLLELKFLNYPGEALTKDNLEALGQHCILLQDVTLNLRRSQGDDKEASLYKALGSVRNLQFITLDLHVDSNFSPNDNEDEEDGTVWNPAFDDEFDRKVPPELLDGTDQCEPCNGAMREQLINCAIDAKLARSIFDAISAGKPHESLPLQELNIMFTTAGKFGSVCCSRDFLSVLFHLCHPWRITPYETEMLEHCEERPKMFQPPPDVLESYLEAIWRRIWPEKISEDWKSDWRSLPISKVT
ncbi:hypothetical protein PENSTE_c006G03289 [Penicillium steckii]|uniref:Uncharacterized protein n=1 Tax=Penicillium steckii TaxID=303698 RepID=A0A1V6TIQ8_9EURO|nr:hypothetical protein PENSTE_c006G03289 [Penicillium steckii]